MLKAFPTHPQGPELLSKYNGASEEAVRDAFERYAKLLFLSGTNSNRSFVIILYFGCVWTCVEDEKEFF